VILYCNCSYSDIVPETVRKAVRAALAGAGGDVVAVPDLCRLSAEKDVRLNELAAMSGLRVVACYPRAVRWLFCAGGAPLNEDAAFFNMREQPVEELHAITGTPSTGNQNALAGIEKDGEWVPWFPVVDYDRCEDCKQCIEFCIFGVYSMSPEGRITVTSPRNCKNNCPACARICPAAAIIFPKCPDVPINGAEPVEVKETVGTGPVPLTEGDELDELLEKRRKRAAAFRAARTGQPK